MFQSRLLGLFDTILGASHVLHLLDIGIHDFESIANFCRSSFDLEHEVLESRLRLLISPRCGQDLRVKLLHFIDTRFEVIDRSVDLVDLTVEECEGVVCHSERDCELLVPVLDLDLKADVGVRGSGLTGKRQDSQLSVPPVGLLSS